MSRRPRKRSSTEFYHIVLKGNNGRDIYSTDNQKDYLTRNLMIYEELGELTVAAWCVMRNHAHIVLKAEFEALIKTFHKMNTKFAIRQNKRFGSAGHVFQGRFWSEPIETEDHLLRAIRYVHNNPVKAGIVETPAEWEWNSYSLYKDQRCNEVMRTAYHLIGGTWQSFERFHVPQDLEFRPLDIYEEELRMRDLYAESVLSEICRRYGIDEWRSDLLCFGAVRDAAQWLVGEKDFSIREVARRLGVSHNTIRRYLEH